MNHQDDVGVASFVNGDDEQLRFDNDDENRQFHEDDNVDDSGRGHEIKHSFDDSNRDSSAGKLFVGGIAWETSEESFSNYFSNYGELIDSVIMMDKFTGRPRGFGFVTFADPADADKVLQQDHVIDGRQVEVKRTVPREDMQVRGVSRTKKIFVGGIPLTLTEDELMEYFSSYGNVVEHQIMLDHTTGRSRGFGFVTFDSEEAVDKVFADGQIHELGGKQVEIKRAEPKRGGGDYSYDSRSRHGGGSSKSYGGFGRGSAGYGGGYGGAKAGRGYGDYGGSYPGYEGYAGGYGGGSAGFYAGYGGYGYGFGFGGPMYGGAGYAGGGYGAAGGYGAPAGYGGGRGYGSGGSGGGGGGYGGKGFGRGGGGGATGGYGGGAAAYGYGYDGSKGYGNAGGGGTGTGTGGAGAGAGAGTGSGSGRFHPYRK